jgi:predicted lysophospholipase L1 biosynthesis ABC-type transport system permease subunit
MYQPFGVGGGRALVWPVVLVRAGRSLPEIATVVATHASAIDPSLPVAVPSALTESIEGELADRRVFAWILSLLGGLGFVLAAVGLYGLLAQMVNERTREFGIRLAIGADRRHVFGLVLRQASWIAVLGGLAGLGLAAFGSRVVEAQLYGVTRLDPRLYAASAVALAVVIFAASAWPARSATRIQPVEALRAE